MPKGLTLGRTQKDSVEGTVSEQSGPTRRDDKDKCQLRVYVEIKQQEFFSELRELKDKDKHLSDSETLPG